LLGFGDSSFELVDRSPKLWNARIINFHALKRVLNDVLVRLQIEPELVKVIGRRLRTLF